jgi:NAD(P)-dependent dehydrogenase (short-subunit alcohol dehydrogenase family)
VKTIREMITLKGRRALITGAAGGIGQQMSLAIAELGGDLVLVDMPGGKCEELVAIVKSISDVNVEPMGCDLEDARSRLDLVKALMSQEEPLNILINNAAFVGTSDLKGWGTDLENQSIETWRRALEVNLTAAFDLSKGLASKLKADGHGSIINVASIYGLNGPDYSLYEGTDMGNAAAYAASKGGLLQLTRWLSTTLAPDIRVNSISPGGVFRNQPSQFVKRYEARTPLGRMATEEDFKGPAIYLASDLSAYMTGQNLIVDGGWTIW